MTRAEPKRRRNHLLWIGPLVTLAGGLSYFTFFARFAPLRDFPWINLPIVLLGVGLSAAGLWRALARSATYRGRIVGSGGLALSSALAALFIGYIFVFSYTLPDPAGTTLAMERAPDFSLRDSAGELVRLGDLRGRKVVLVFYRGFW